MLVSPAPNPNPDPAPAPGRPRLPRATRRWRTSRPPAGRWGAVAGPWRAWPAGRRPARGARRGRGFCLDVQPQDGQRILGDERWRTGEEFVERAAEGVDVTGGSGGPAERGLGGDVEAGAHHRTGLGDVRRGGAGQAPGDAEVGDLHRAALRQHQVGGLHIAVDHPVLVRRGEPRRGLGRDPGHLIRGQRSPPAQLLGQVVALDQLHDQEAVVAGDAEVVNGHQMGVVEPGRRTGLPFESRGQRLVVGGAFREQLQGHRTLQAFVPRPPHLAHAAAPEGHVEAITLRHEHGTAPSTAGGHEREGQQLTPNDRMPCEDVRMSCLPRTGTPGPPRQDADPRARRTPA